VAQLKSVAVILNPASGGGAGRKQRPNIERGLTDRGITHRVLETSGSGDAREFAHDLARSGTTCIVAAGGDGTIHEVANGILRAQVQGRCALGLIPVGTGNEFVKVVPGTRTLEQALNTIARGVVRRYDVGHVRWHDEDEYFVNGMGTGIDVEVVRQLGHLPRMPGALKYFLALVRALFYYKPINLVAELDGERLAQRVMIIAVGNGVCQGGGFYLAPKASPADGQLDVCVVDRLNLAGIVRVIPQILRGTQEGDPAVLMRTAQSIRVATADERPLFFHLDGELRQPAGLRSLHVQILPGALPVLTEEA
jgi:YegS/Rv2252/BmrU family lipid kinase